MAEGTTRRLLLFSHRYFGMTELVKRHAKQSCVPQFRDVSRTDDLSVRQLLS